MIHLLATAYHIGETVVHASLGNEAKAVAGALKTVASLVPGGSFVAGAAINSAIQSAVVDQNFDTAEHLAGNALDNTLDNQDDILDSIAGLFDSM